MTTSSTFDCIFAPIFVPHRTHSTAPHLQYAGELGVAVGDVPPLRALRQRVDHVAQLQQPLVDAHALREARAWTGRGRGTRWEKPCQEPFEKPPKTVTVQTVWRATCNTMPGHTRPPPSHTQLLSDTQAHPFHPQATGTAITYMHDNVHRNNAHSGLMRRCCFCRTFRARVLDPLRAGQVHQVQPRPQEAQRGRDGRACRKRRWMTRRKNGMDSPGRKQMHTHSHIMPVVSA